jgi:hypothetical protein
MLAAAWSCAVTAEGGREEFVGAHTVAADGRVLLNVPEDSSLFTAAICAPRGEPSAVLEFADVAPVPVRSRIRARVWIAGWFAPEEEQLAFRPTRVVLRQPSGAVVVDLDDCHADAVERLTRLVEPDSLHGAVRVQPLAVDRHGLTLRIERVRGHGDVRLTFHKPADDVAQLTERMHVLLSQAARAAQTACPRALQRQRTEGEG